MTIQRSGTASQESGATASKRPALKCGSGSNCLMTWRDLLYTSLAGCNTYERRMYWAASANVLLRTASDVGSAPAGAAACSRGSSQFSTCSHRSNGSEDSNSVKHCLFIAFSHKCCKYRSPSHLCPTSLEIHQGMHCVAARPEESLPAPTLVSLQPTHPRASMCMLISKYTVWRQHIQHSVGHTGSQALNSELSKGNDTSSNQVQLF